MDLFNTYVGDFDECAGSVRHSLTRVAQPGLGDERRIIMEDMQSQLSEMETTLQSMRLQARTVSGTMQGDAQARMRQCETELRDLKDQVRRSELAFTNSRNRELLFSGGTELQVTSLDQRDELQRTTDQFSHNNMRLHDSERILEDTIETGVGILHELDDQGNRIRGMRERMRDIGVDIEQANRVLKKMVWTMYQNKFILLIAMLVIFLIIIAVAYIKWFFPWPFGGSDSSDDTSSDPVAKYF